MPPADYRLIDFGDGRKLESIGSYRIDRPCPAAAGATRQSPAAWGTADAIYQADRQGGGWTFRVPWPDDLHVEGESFRMPSRPTPFGHVGFFPEQRPNWRWIQEIVRGWRGPRVLNLFAYTGASTLAAAASGAHATHVDAAKPNVMAARRAADLSGLGGSPIRYLVDDARKFVARELRRSNRYDLIILDPPAYGHANRGSAWRLERDLWPLLDQCLDLLPRDRGGVLLSGHSQAVGHGEVIDWFRQRGPRGCDIQAGRSTLRTDDGRSLDAGFFVRVRWQSSDPRNHR